MNMVTLKNGAVEAEPLVKVTMMSLGRLWDENPICAYELVMLCRDSNHKPFGNSDKILVELALVQNGRVHDSIRNIVLSSVSGEGLEMTFGSPVKSVSDGGVR